MNTPLIAYYGDDFTGSTDVMEALASNGIETVLFLDQVEPDVVAAFPQVRAIGLAGTSRSQTPAWMDENLPGAFAWLKRFNADLYHYKVCSTFDSAPEVGNIGRAIEIGRSSFASQQVPLVVGAPQIGRYTAFGNLFAAYQGEIHRIDRHPVMSRHPVTPMGEADIGRHLSRQTPLACSVHDVVALRAGRAPPGTDIVVIDVLDEDTQRAAGLLLWHGFRMTSPFLCGSSGVEYALVHALRADGLIGGRPHFADAGPVERLAVVSGSVSPTTERQIRHALAQGFEGVALDPVALARGEGVDAAIEAGLAVLTAGRSVILYTALGPGEDQGAALTAVGARHRVGRSLGEIEKALIVRAGLTRAVISGGDTSSHALSAMGISALTLKMPLPQTPGSPLCLAHGGGLGRLEIALKGGQVGHDDYFSMIRDGRCR